mmetsp:Transcript_57595/g.160430  ORF Transcript_57595/g.160430 Transcript_57595/m.160430 type:complete len:360 (-) Transcript_57595:228-1307(-)
MACAPGRLMPSCPKTSGAAKIPFSNSSQLTFASPSLSNPSNQSDKLLRRLVSLHIRSFSSSLRSFNTVVYMNSMKMLFTNAMTAKLPKMTNTTIMKPAMRVSFVFNSGWIALCLHLSPWNNVSIKSRMLVPMVRKRPCNSCSMPALGPKSSVITSEHTKMYTASMMKAQIAWSTDLLAPPTMALQVCQNLPKSDMRASWKLRMVRLATPMTRPSSEDRGTLTILKNRLSAIHADKTTKSKRYLPFFHQGFTAPAARTISSKILKTMNAKSMHAYTASDFWMPLECCTSASASANMNKWFAKRATTIAYWNCLLRTRLMHRTTASDLLLTPRTSSKADTPSSFKSACIARRMTPGGLGAN